jgi:YHS domain-containing protein
MRIKGLPMAVASVSTVLAVLMLMAADRPATGDGPQFTADGQLIRPKNYREWIYLSSGLGMTYGPAAEALRDNHPAFDNVFVNPAAYRSFIETGKWPDKTIFVLEVRTSESKGSINNGGHYQSGMVTVEAEVKDEKRFPGKWAFFALGKTASEAKMIPRSASCYSCHSEHGAVDNTFVQFYPTLLEVAQRKGTLVVRAAASPSAVVDAKAAPAAAAEARVIDVVCNMPVVPKTALKTEYQGKTYYFCQPDCKDNFEGSPGSYAAAKPGATASK